MSDQNVKAAQKYLNAMFGGHKDWVKLDEDGKTGTAVMQGIIRAFQIQNGISTITGTVGPLTINTMKKLAIITKMDPNDTPQVYGKFGCRLIFAITQLKSYVRIFQFLLLGNRKRGAYWKMKLETNREVWNSERIKRILK